MIGLLALAASAAARPAIAPKPLFRDPVYDGAADPSTVRDPKTGEWVMFYTNRRASLPPTADPRDVSWLHATHIGMARSSDGAHWRYAGVANIPASCTGATLWAPDVEWLGGRWHMWITVVPGVFKDWNARRFLVHLTSRDLKSWRCGERLDLGSDRVIDASVAALPGGGYRMWFNDERMNKAIRSADSPDLVRWTVGETVVDTPGEGPKGFRWKGKWWLISDAWKGLLVMRSDDGSRWTRQAEYLLADAGASETDRAKGQHPDVIVASDRAYLIYFVHQTNEPQAAKDKGWARRTVIQITELHEQDGVVTVDRNAPAEVDLSGR